MNARRFSVVPLLLALGALSPPGATAQEKKSSEIDKATVDAWVKRGFKSGWVSVRGRKTEFTTDPKEFDGAIPGFLVGPKLPVAELKSLPAVGVSFGLALSTTQATEDGLKHLTGLKNLTALSLNTSGNSTTLTDAGLTPLADLKPLAALSLRGLPITDKGLEHLAGLTNLSELRLTGTQITDDGLKHLADLKKLAFLDLSYTRITGDGLKHLAKLKNLTALGLGATRVTNDSLKHLAGLEHLNSLLLAGTAVTGEGLKELAALPNLTNLYLGYTRLTPRDLVALAGLKKLNTLEVEANKITDEVVEALAKGGSVHALAWAMAADGKRPTKPEDVVSLNLRNTKCTDAVLKHFTGFTNLATLNLYDFPVTGDGLKPLAGLKKLTAVNVHPSRVTDDIVRVLAQGGTLHALTPVVAGAEGLLPTRPEEVVRFPQPWTDGIPPGKRPTKPDEVVAIYLAGTQVTDEGLKHFAGFTNVSQLHIVRHAGTGEGLKHLAGLKKLTRLTLESNTINDAGVAAAARFESLTTLTLGGRFTADGLKPLGKLANLASLSLERGIPGEGLKHLSGLKKLTSVEMKPDLVTDAALAALDEAGLIHALAPFATAVDGKRPTKPEEVVGVDLNGTAVTHQGLKHLAGLKNLATLKLGLLRVRNIDLRLPFGPADLTRFSLQVRIYPGAALGLAPLTGLKKLTTLDMHPALVTDQTLGILADAGLVHSLTQATAADGKRPTKPEEVVDLKLNGTPVTDKGLKHLYGLTNLQKLTLTGTRVTASGVEALKAALPKCEVVMK